MRIETVIPQALHICPACEENLASDRLLCRDCLDKGRYFLELVGAGVIDPADNPLHAHLAQDAREMQEALAPLLSLPGIAPIAPVTPVRWHRPILSTPERGSRCMDTVWAVAAVIFCAGLLAVLGVTQLWNDVWD